MRRALLAGLLALAVTALAEAPAMAKGTKIVVAESEFGRMLWGPGRQAIYAFELDERDRSNCYGDCADAWPPVFAKGRPVAGDGVRKRLLGTTRRRGGRRQVTYAGKPLYYYVNEGPGEVPLPQRPPERRAVVGAGPGRRAPAVARERGARGSQGGWRPPSTWRSLARPGADPAPGPRRG